MSRLSSRSCKKTRQGAVCFLNIFVQAFQNFPKSIRQRKHDCAAGEKDVQKTRLEPQNSGHCAQQAYQHSDHPGHDLGHAARYHGGVRCKAIHPFAGMHRRDRCIITGKQDGEEPVLEAVFHGGAGVLTQKATRRAQHDLPQQDAHQQRQRCPKTALHPVHGHVDDAPQHERKGDAGNAQHGLHHYQQPYQPFGTAGDGAEPLQGMFLFHRCSFRFSDFHLSLPYKSGLRRKKKSAQRCE